jgi:glycosyltransferase involved in cell wall biosynthesis
MLSGKQGFKFIFVPAGLTEIGNLRTSLPLVAVGDCSTLQLFDYYPALMNVSAHSRHDVERVERSALAKCARIVFSSRWAADFVTTRYLAQCFVIPFGANIQDQNAPMPQRMNNGCRLLLVGVDWLRKGGDIAMEIHRRLLSLKIPCSLTVAGMKPGENVSLPENVEFVFIDKDSESGERHYMELLNNSDLLLLPTVADCTPIVIAEAFAAGLPVLATRTGGIPSMVDEGVTGFLFEPADSSGYVDRIEKFWRDPNLLRKMSSNCVIASRSMFNWKKWASEIEKLCAPL